MKQDFSEYGEAFSAVLPAERVAALGPGEPESELRSTLAALDVETAFAEHDVIDREMASACLCAAWLYNDFLEESHTLSQSIDTATGSFWHGIMHRREPDAGNARYWFRRTGEHPVCGDLAAASVKIAAEDTPTAVIDLMSEPVYESGWDPFHFIDLCEVSRGTGDALEDWCQRMQRREWEILFDFSFRRAVGQ